MVVFDSDRAPLAVQMLWTPIYKQSEEGTINNSSQGCLFFQNIYKQSNESNSYSTTTTIVISDG